MRKLAAFAFAFTLAGCPGLSALNGPVKAHDAGTPPAPVAKKLGHIGAVDMPAEGCDLIEVRDGDAPASFLTVCANDAPAAPKTSSKKP